MNGETPHREATGPDASLPGTPLPGTPVPDVPGFGASGFGFEGECEEMCATVLAFARRELTARGGAAHPAFDAGDFRRRWRLAGAQGLVGGTVPVDYGGSGLDAVTASAVMEALGRGTEDTGFAFSVAAHLFASLMPITEFGTEEQKRAWLPALCSGSGSRRTASPSPRPGPTRSVCAPAPNARATRTSSTAPSASRRTRPSPTSSSSRRRPNRAAASSG